MKKRSRRCMAGERRDCFHLGYLDVLMRIEDTPSVLRGSFDALVRCMNRGCSLCLKKTAISISARPQLNLTLDRCQLYFKGLIIETLESMQTRTIRAFPVLKKLQSRARP